MKVEWMPFELRPYPTPTLKPDGEYLEKAWSNSVYPLAERLGVEMKLPTVSPQPYTALAFQGLQFAKHHGRADAYNDEVFKAFFQRSEDIGNLDVLTEIARKVGLDAEEFRNALETDAYGAETRRLLRHSREEAGISAVPTFFIGRRRLSGLYPAETLSQAIDEELAAASAQQVG